jgi:hypothetical protein
LSFVGEESGLLLDHGSGETEEVGQKDHLATAGGFRGHTLDFSIVVLDQVNVGVSHLQFEILSSFQQNILQRTEHPIPSDINEFLFSHLLIHNHHYLFSQDWNVFDVIGLTGFQILLFN